MNASPVERRATNQATQWPPKRIPALICIGAIHRPATRLAKWTVPIFVYRFLSPVCRITINESATLKGFKLNYRVYDDGGNGYGTVNYFTYLSTQTQTHRQRLRQHEPIFYNNVPIHMGFLSFFLLSSLENGVCSGKKISTRPEIVAFDSNWPVFSCNHGKCMLTFSFPGKTAEYIK